MAYSNNYQSARPANGSNGGNYSRGSFANGYNAGGYADNAPRNRGYRSNGGGYASGNSSNGAPKKHSGCKMKSSYVRRSTGEQVDAPCITGWKKPAGQPFMSFVAVPNKNPGTKSDRWKKFIVTIQRENQAPEITTGFWDVNKKVLRLPDYNMVANPAGGPGGYWGRSGPPSKRS